MAITSRNIIGQGKQYGIAKILYNTIYDSEKGFPFFIFNFFADLRRQRTRTPQKRMSMGSGVIVPADSSVSA